MSSEASGASICAYCGGMVLTGDEDPEHVLPAAINARLTTTAVCDPCNRWAGKAVDQPWLDDPFVGHLRFLHRIPDRKGRLLDHDPFLAGVTEEGTQVRMNREGQPVALNSPVAFDPNTGEYRIHAKDEADLERLFDRIARKAERAGKTATPGQRELRSHQPRVEVRFVVYPSRWERMAAKALLGLLSATMPAAWRSAPSAEQLRAQMRLPNRPADEVRLVTAEAFASFAPPPASFLFVRDIGGRALAGASLMGMVLVGWPLCDDLKGQDIAWVSDPVQPARSARGPFHEVIGRRLL